MTANQTSYEAKLVQAWKLRQAGKSFFEIAEILRLPEAQLRSGISAAIAAAAEMVSAGARREVLALEFSRLDALQAAAWDDAMAGDVRSGEFILKVMSTRLKWMGYDTPEVDQQRREDSVIIQGHSEEYTEALRAIREGIVG